MVRFKKIQEMLVRWQTSDVDACAARGEDWENLDKTDPFIMERWCGCKELGWRRTEGLE